METRALSIRQPWATLIMLGRKTIESRAANSKRRGRVFIHASATKLGPTERAVAIREGLDPDTLPRGVILGSAEIVDAQPAERLQMSATERRLGYYGPGRWGWRLAYVEQLQAPVACSGALSFWRVPANVMTEIADQLGDLVFVYGTLKRGGGNHRLLKTGAAYIGEDQVRGAMHDLGAFPGVHLLSDGIVHGEIYRISLETLGRLDRLEGVPSFYQRSRVTTRSGARVWIYTMSPARLAPRRMIASGRWAA